MKKQEFLKMMQEFAQNGFEDDDDAPEADQDKGDSPNKNPEDQPSKESPSNDTDGDGEETPEEETNTTSDGSDDDDAGAEESRDDSPPNDNADRGKIHKLNKENQSLRKRAKEAEQKLLRYEIPKEAGVPPTLAGWVRGGTKEEIEADAKKLTEALKSLAKGGGRSFFDGLNQDTRGTKPDDEADLDKIGARIYKR